MTAAAAGLPRVVAACRAQAVEGCAAVEPVTIHIFQEVDDRDDARAVFKRDAEAIADALWQALPGGTIDALLVAFLDKRASQLRVPHPANDRSTQ